MPEFVLEFLQLPKQVGDACLELFLFCLGNLGIFLVLIQQPLNLQVVALLKSSDVLGLLVFLFSQHLLIHINLQLIALPQCLVLGLELAYLLHLYSTGRLQLSNSFLLHFNLLGHRDFLVQEILGQLLRSIA